MYKSLLEDLDSTQKFKIQRPRVSKALALTHAKTVKRFSNLVDYSSPSQAKKTTALRPSF